MKMEMNIKFVKIVVFVLIAMSVFAISSESSVARAEGKDSSLIGYEFLDDQTVLHIWNIYEDYYFDIDNQCYAQITNHYDDYWSRNTFGFGIEVYGQWYYYESDKFCDWEFEIETDNINYVRFKLSESMKIYPYSKIDLYISNELTNQDPRLSMDFGIHHNAGYDITNSRFRWHIDNIQINMEEEDNFIWIDNNTYDLSDDLDLEFANLPYGYFKIYENESGEFISMNWESNSYDDIVTIKSYESSSYNSPVSLIAELGEISYGETKTFSSQWIDRTKECSPPFSAHFNNPPNHEEYNINDTFMMEGHWHDSNNNPWGFCYYPSLWKGTVQINQTGTWYLINAYAPYGVQLNGLSGSGMPYMSGRTSEEIDPFAHQPNPYMEGNLTCSQAGTHNLKYEVFHSLYGWMGSQRDITCLAPEEPEEPIESYQLALLLGLFGSALFFILWATKLDDDHIPLKILFRAYGLVLFIAVFHMAALFSEFDIGSTYPGMLYLAIASGFIGSVLWLKRLLTGINNC